MNDRVLLVKLFNLNNVNIGKGGLLSIKNNIIMVKGKKLPILCAGAYIIINIYDELVGICPYLCKVSVSSKNQLTAIIVRKDSIIERRKSLKVRTDLSFYVNKIERNDEDITDSLPNIKINILNLSIGGMLISSNVELLLNDVITYYFEYNKYKSIPLEAKISRIDKFTDNHDNDYDDYDDYDDYENKKTFNYGCYFVSISSSDESVICQYLFDRQIQLYRN